MGGFAGTEEVVLLLDHGDRYGMELYGSLCRAFGGCTAVLLEDDGEDLPGMLSPFAFFCKDGTKEEEDPCRRGRFFNEVPVPRYWEISGNGSSGSVHDLYHERARIYYREPKQKRIVRVVDWLDLSGKVRFCDHYDRGGRLFARTHLDGAGRKFMKTWFSPAGREVLTENYVTGDLILNEGEKTRIFRDKTGFIIYFLEKAGLAERRVFYNSLALPFFVSQRLPREERRDILFWQEKVGDEIPGNMRFILNGQQTHTGRILVQRREAYEKLIQLGADPALVRPLGFIYPFVRDNRRGNKVLICTNSDQVLHLEELARLLPEAEFSVAALTEMSAKLLDKGKLANVRLYPTVTEKKLEELFEECDYYLDINRGAEIVSALYRAFLNRQLILAFRETAHGLDYVAGEHLFDEKDYAGLAACLAEYMDSSVSSKQALARQEKAAMAETEEAYSAACYAAFPGKPR